MTDYRWCSMRAPKSIGRNRTQPVLLMHRRRGGRITGDSGVGAGLGTCARTGVSAGDGTGMSTGIGTFIGTGVATGMSTGVATGMSTGVGTGMSTGVGTGMSTGVGTGMSTGVGTGMSTGVGTGCTACVIIKAVMRFPQYRLNINDRGLQSLVSHRLRYLMSRGQYPGEVWYYAYFPSAKEHNHVMLASAPGVHLPQAMSDLSDNSRLVTLDLSGLPVAKQPADASVEIEDSTISFDNHQSSLRLLRQLNMTDCVVRSETSFLALLRRLQQYLTQQRQQSTKPRQPSNLRAGCLGARIN
ncbi:hypothetical protein BOX15_Mlig026506g1 [Macrostomum lignano]|uniref:Uncharacterized protein n=1 Tax=Macrostomum lignano TaxID=282301 RepID=A0A267E728_9PLAT|nr:hypothetical protein BOX15_Mlig026506g1 [Macrostomum lignano]